MRLLPLLRVGLPVLCLLALAPPAAEADNGGAQAPSGEGGSQQTTPIERPQRRPVAQTFHATPRRVKAGHLPRIAVRIDQRGVKRVSLRIALIRVGHHRATATIIVKNARTGRLLHPHWPKATKLQEGHYIVRVHAKAPDGATLRRTGNASGKLTIAVTAKAKRKPEPVLLPPAAGGVFPVAGPHSYGEDGARFGAKRKGHIHEGQDVIADRGTPVVAPLAGTIGLSDYQKGGAGYYIVLDAADDRAFFFAHCRKDTVVVETGQPVAAGQRLCDVGRTGDASGPHLHFEIWVGGWRRDKRSHPIDPLDQLRAWDR